MKALLTQLLVLIACFLAGAACQNLALPPDYASPIWLPAGIGLGAILVFGYRLWTAVFFSSLLINVYIAWSGGTLPSTPHLVPIGIAAGSTFQALLGAWLVRKFVNYPLPLDELSSILKFQFLAGPLSCCVAAITGNFTLYFFGILHGDAFLMSLLNWWVGDILGIVLGTTLFLAFFGEPKHVWRKRRLSVVTPILVIASLSIISFFYVFESEKRKMYQSFQNTAESTNSAIQSELSACYLVLDSIKSLFTSSEFVNRTEFSTFSSALLKSHNHILGLEWIPIVPHSKRSQYESLAQSEGIEGFMFFEKNIRGQIIPAKRRDFYFPVYYVEPLVGNTKALGYDLGSSEERLKAINSARDTGKMSSTSAIHLVQHRKEKTGILIFNPIYNTANTPSTVLERRKEFAGFALGVFKIENIIEFATSTTKQYQLLDNRLKNHISLKIFDLNAQPSKQLIFRSGSLNNERFGISHKITKRMIVGGRHWEIEYNLGKQFFTSEGSLAAYGTLIFSMLFSGLMTTFLLTTSGYSYRMEMQVADRTQELRISKDLESSRAKELEKINQELRTFNRLAVGRETTMIQLKKQITDLKHQLGDRADGADQNADSAIDIADIWQFGIEGTDTSHKATLNMLQDMEISRNKLTESVQRFQLVTEGASVGIWDWKDINKDEEYWSPRFYQLLGYEDQEIPATLKNFSDMLHPEDKKSTFALVEKHFKGDSDFDTEYRLRTKSGQYRWFKGTGKVSRDEHGNPTRMVGSIEDIHNRKVLEENLKRSNKELEQFAYVASHDLQAPLRHISSYVEMLNDELNLENNPEYKKWMGYILNGTREMRSLISDLLAFSRVGKEGQQIETVPLQALVASLVKELDPIDEANFAYENLPEIQGYTRQLRQLFQNLFHNALKFRKPNVRPEISISVEDKEAEWLVFVTDNGIGIDKQYQQRVFEVFQRLHSSKDYTGTGIGLAICKKVIALHGGQIWLESSGGKGSTFIFTISKNLGISDERQQKVRQAA